MNAAPPSQKDTFPALQDDFNVRNPVKFIDGDLRSPDMLMENGVPAMDLSSGPPPLPRPTRLRRNLLIAGFTIAGLDLCVMPITYFYALTYGTKYTKQTVFIVITCLFCMMTFAHYTHRCLRLMLKCSDRYGPIGWSRKWRLLEFTNVNFAICASIFETILVVGTAPTDPLVRVCVLPSTIICYYFSILFLLTAFLTQYRYRLPFAMSSTPKGSPWRPALLAALEDGGSIEARCEVGFREAVMRRYEASPVFRRLLLRLTWGWGWGLASAAVATSIVIAVTPDENVAFGVGWGLPYVFVAVYMVVSVIFVRRSLEEERRTWKGERGVEMT